MTTSVSPRSARSRKLSEALRVIGQLTVGGMALRGFACSYPHNYVLPLAASESLPKEPSSEVCARLCAPVLGGEAYEINSCEIATSYAPMPRPDAIPVAGENPVVRGAQQIYVVCDVQIRPTGGAGRAPADLREPSSAPKIASALSPAARRRAERFAALARLEDASVFAFLELTAELRAHGAPELLVRACEASAIDEARHARDMTALARAFGACPVRADVAPTPIRDLETIATSNAVEGCVRETFGAVTAIHAARSATSAEVRTVMRSIAADEARHAALSWTLHRWVIARLPAPAARRANDAVHEALAGLAIDGDSGDELAGAPSPEIAADLLAGLRSEIEHRA